MKIDKTTPFWDETKPNSERIDWLLSQMTLEEKAEWISSGVSDLERLGIPATGVGSEAAHGVEARNDQNKLGDPDITTSFPQPIGMSASWDKELIRKAGEVTGTEARAVFTRHSRFGLVRWAPTVDAERDPRWGRNEEAYGEDPFLIGAMAGNYIRGIQGDDPRYLRCGATLKHFYANNVEVGRTWKNSSIDPRNKYEYYLEPFRRCIEQGHVEAVMASYNKINGTVGMLNPDILNILKKEYGLKHAVSDGGATSLVVKEHHYYGKHAETIAAALKAGVDGMSDDPKMVKEATLEALELGLITEEDLDTAIRNVLDTKLRLGIYDRNVVNPYMNVSEEVLCCEAHKEVCLRLSRESVVLLKNEKNLLPLSETMDAEDMALVGPLADTWHLDWYGGMPEYRTTLKDGFAKLGKDIKAYADGYDRVIFRYQEKGLAATEDGKLVLSDTPDTFIKEEWGEGSYTLRCERTGKYVKLHPMEETFGVKNVVKGEMFVDAAEAFDWFVTEILHMEEQNDGSVILHDRFHYPLMVQEDGTVKTGDLWEGTPFTMEIMEDGIAKAVEMAKGKKAVFLAIGTNPMVNAKEEIDRKTLLLPELQRKLVREITKVNPNTVIVLFANYPYAMKEESDAAGAVISSSTGSQDMGLAMAEAILGRFSPAGRLNMTWYLSEDDLPDMDDYDIIKGKRTYRYFDKEVLYPFGYGLGYTNFAQEHLTVVKKGDLLRVSVTVKNTGDMTSDEVVQIYASFPKSRAVKPLRQLIAFERLKGIAPGESRIVEFDIPVSELRFYDVTQEKMIVEEGMYTIFTARDAVTPIEKREVFILGEKTGTRDVSSKIRATHYDDYENMWLLEGHFGYEAVSPRDSDLKGSATYRDCAFPEGTKGVLLHMLSKQGVNVKVFINGEQVGSYEGDTASCEHNSGAKPDRYAEEELRIRQKYREPIYEDVPVLFAKEIVPKEAAELRIEFDGDVKFCYFTAWK